ncbi:MAG: DHH family phosphoesterase [Candidatus Hadarchaeota archaeon]
MGRSEVKIFQRAASDVAEFLKLRLDGKRRVTVMSHVDADGISAASVMARCLYSFDVPFTVRFTQPLSSEEMAALPVSPQDLFIFLDQGSGQLDAIHKSILSKGAEAVIIDHHPATSKEHPNLAQLNPHLCGLNGAKDVSASGGAYLVADALDIHFRPWAGLALVGAVGDRQEFFSEFTGANDVIAKRALDLGLIEAGVGLRLVGRTFLPVAECIRSSTRPYIPGLSKSLAACRALVESIGINLSSKIFELQPDDERALADAIFARVGPLAANEDFQHTIWGPIYTVMTGDVVGPRDLREQAALFDACGNMKKPEVGLAVGAGDETALEEAVALLRAVQDEMLKTLDWFKGKLAYLKQTKYFRYINSGSEVNPGMVGEAISLLIESGMISMDVPVMALAETKTGMIKISARSTPGLAMKGVNMGAALEKACTDVGGYGGGHDVSAGGRVPKDKVDEFITRLDNVFGEAIA